jgi:hypothetical protein
MRLFILSILFILALAKHQDTLERNDRGMTESNRDFTNMLQHGFLKGLLKVDLSGQTDCKASGMGLARSIYKVGKQAL